MTSQNNEKQVDLPLATEDAQLTQKLKLQQNQVAVRSSSASPLLVDFTNFFGEHLEILDAEISETSLKLQLKNRNNEDKKIDLEIWKRENLRVDIYILQPSKNGGIFEISWEPKETKDLPIDIEPTLLGWVEMKLYAKRQKKGDEEWQESVNREESKLSTLYSCLRLELLEGRIVPSFSKSRPLFGGRAVKENAEDVEVIPAFRQIISGARFDQTFLELFLENKDHPELTLSFSYLYPRNAGIRYIFPGWDDPEIDPTKKAFTIPHKENVSVGISFYLPRTQERLRKMATCERNHDDAKGILVTLKLEAIGSTHWINVHFVWDQEINNWTVSLLDEKPAPREQWPKSSWTPPNRIKFSIA